MSTVTTTREQLRALVEELPDELLRDALYALTHLDDDDNEPLSEREAEDVQSALDDRKYGRMISMEDYESQRGL